MAEIRMLKIIYFTNSFHILKFSFIVLTVKLDLYTIEDIQIDRLENL